MTQERAHLHVLTPNLQLETRSERLRFAVRSAGGNQVVVQKSGVKLSTLGSYLAGGEQKLSATVALAAACGVTVEWLATGRGPMRPGEAELPPPPPESPPPPTLFSLVDMALMGQCIEAAMLQLARDNPSPDWRRIAQVAALLYDALKEDREKRAAQPAPAAPAREPSR